MTTSKRVRFAQATLLSTAAVLMAAPAVSHAAEPAALSASQLKAQGKVRVVVAFKAGAGAAARAAIAAAGGRTVLDLADLNAVAIEVPRKALALLQRNPNVEFAEEDGVRHALGNTSKAPLRTAVAAVAAGSQVVPYGIPMVQADQVSDSLAAGRKLCIVDSGYDLAHEDLAGNTVDGVNLTTSGQWSTDELGHGTHVAGTIAAVNNDLGVIGVLPNKNIRLHIAKVFDASGSAPTSIIVKGMLACMKAKANVVSMSLGGASAQKIEEKVVDLMARRNMLLIAAAGNAGTSAVSYPAGFESVVSVGALDSNKTVATFSQFNPDVEISGPGVAVLSSVPMGTGSEAALSVAGTTYPVLGMEGSPNLTRTAPLADFGLGDTVNPAMTGKTCLIARGTIAFSDKVLNCQASGGVAAVIYNNTSGPLNGTLSGVATTIPSVGASDTDGAALLGKLGQPATVSVAVSNYAFFDGTSMATPHVSAVAALVWSHFPSCSAAQIRTTLDKSAQDLGTAGRDVYYGYGLVQAKAAFDRINTLGCGQ